VFLIVGVFILTFPQRHEILLIVALLLFLPGRVQGYYYRDFFRGRREMGLGEFESALGHFTKFAEDVSNRPWLKRLIWLSFGVYTTDIEAMTHNNLGACYLEKGELTKSKTALYRALEICPTYPIPYFNLALLYGLTGERREAVRCFQEAKRRGYDLSRFDQVLNSLSQGLANIEGGDSGQPSGNNIQSPSLLARASVLESIGLLEDSEQLLAQAAKNQEPGADLTRAFCLMRLGRLEEAKAALDKLPADSTAGRLEEAKKALEDALDVESSSAPSKALLAQLALKEEKWETALALAEESLAMSESGWALEARAYALQALGKVEEATEAFESFLEFGEVVRPLEGDLGERLAMARREKSHAP
jgi:tetratricopeptide (TPR) repeat protein